MATETRQIDRKEDRATPSSGKAEELLQEMSAQGIPPDEVNKIQTKYSETTGIELEQIDAAQEQLGEVASYFGLQEQLPSIEKAFGPPLNFSVLGILTKYKNYIEKELALPPGSTLEQNDHTRLIKNLKTIIADKLSALPALVAETREKNDGGLAEMRWIINQEIVDSFALVHESLLPSAKFFLDFSNSEYAALLKEAHPGSATAAQIRYLNIKEELVDAEISDGEIPTGIIGNDSFWNPQANDRIQSDRALLSFNPTRFAEWKTAGRPRQFTPSAAALADPSVIQSSIEQSGITEISFLSEEDEKIESDATMMIIAATIPQVIPVAGAVVSLPIDLTNIASEQLATLMVLKKAGYVPEEYHMAKPVWMNFVAAISVVGDLIGLQALPKVVKIGRLTSKLEKLRGFSLQKLKVAMQRLGIDLNKYSDLFAGFGRGVSKPAAEGRLIRAEAKSGISRDEVLQNATLDDKGRLQVAEKSLGRELTPDQQQAVIDAHNYGDNAVFEYTQGEKIVKGRKLMQVGFTKEETRKLLDEGIAGKSKITLRKTLAEERLGENVEKLPPELQFKEVILKEKFPEKVMNDLKRVADLFTQTDDFVDDFYGASAMKNANLFDEDFIKLRDKMEVLASLDMKYQRFTGSEIASVQNARKAMREQMRGFKNQIARINQHLDRLEAKGKIKPDDAKKVRYIIKIHEFHGSIRNRYLPNE